jgi:TRAP-type uncharacterized transport system fused permease subunit
VILVGVLLAGFSAPYAALCGIAATIPSALLRRRTRSSITFSTVIDALASGAFYTLGVAAACACAGIVIGVITLTGAGLAFTGLVVDAAQDVLLPALVLTMIAGIILGMGIPTTPAYIVQVALLVPALINLGVAAHTAHLFVLYYAVLSAITPPVAMAVFAANSISGARLTETAIAAVKLGATGYIVPFMFVYGPSLLMTGEPLSVFWAAVSATVGVTCLAASLHGYLLVTAPWWQRLMLFVAAMALIKPGLTTDAVGGALLFAVVAAQLATRRKLAPAAR